jgi:formylglycine-generating enzyme required for sulfatase activity
VQLPPVITNSIGMELVLVPAGKFRMGSGETEPAHQGHEGPVREVEITRPFYMGIHEVTVGQFKQFVKDAGYKTQAETEGGALRYFPDGKWENDPKASWRNPGFVQTDEHPVVCVSWNDAQAFCKWLGQVESKKYRLPTEAEWEHACRAGTKTRWYSGDDEASLKDVANIADAALKKALPVGDAHPWNDGYAFTAPVGRFMPNAFGLYDMHGNAWEWCQDWYDPDYYKKGPREDPEGPVAGGTRVLRGGSWGDGAPNARSAYRSGHYVPSHRHCRLGFRAVRVR